MIDAYTLGALSAGGNTGRRALYRPLLQNWPKVPPAYPYRWDYGGTPEEQARAAAGDLERAIRQEGADQVAAFVAEPVSGASIPAAHPHPAYYEEVCRICDEHNVVFIADEIITGSGRTGRCSRASGTMSSRTCSRSARGCRRATLRRLILDRSAGHRSTVTGKPSLLGSKL